MLSSDAEGTVSYLIDLIQEASKALKVDPSELQYNQLGKYCKEVRENNFFEAQPRFRLLGGYTAIRDAKFSPKAKALPTDKVLLKKEAKENRAVTTMATQDAIFLKRLEELSEKSFAKKIVPSGFSKKALRKPELKGIVREVNLLLSDLHFGSALDPREVPLQFGPHEEARRLAQVVLQAAEYKLPYRKESRLRLHIAGDVIQGQLHDMRDGEPLAAQACAAIYLLVQAVGYLASVFPEVIIDFTPGNHDRFTARHKERATNQKWDSLATVIYYAIKTASAHLANVKCEFTRMPFVQYNSFGAKCFGTHGDTVIAPGYPGSSVNVKGLESQINRINAALPNADEYKLFWVGHVHVGMLLHMSNGAKLITNGALIPSDEYGLSIGLFEATCGQSIWESVPNHVVGDYRFAEVNGGTDKDAALESVIKPFLNL